MAIIEDVSTHAKVGKKRGKTKLFDDHDYFSQKISLLDLFLQSNDHRGFIHNIFNNFFINIIY